MGAWAGTDLEVLQGSPDISLHLKGFGVVLFNAHRLLWGTPL